MRAGSATHGSMFNRHNGEGVFAGLPTCSKRRCVLLRVVDGAPSRGAEDHCRGRRSRHHMGLCLNREHVVQGVQFHAELVLRTGRGGMAAVGDFGSQVRRWWDKIVAPCSRGTATWSAADRLTDHDGDGEADVGLHSSLGILRDHDPYVWVVARQVDVLDVDDESDVREPVDVADLVRPTTSGTVVNPVIMAEMNIVMTLLCVYDREPCWWIGVDHCPTATVSDASCWSTGSCDRVSRRGIAGPDR